MTLINKLPLITFVCALLVWASNTARAEDLVSTVDRNQISIDETLKLTVQYSGNKSRGKPNFNKLESEFEILSMESGNKIFGNMSNLTSITQWTMVLSPKKEGTLTVPVFSYANVKSAPIKVKVSQQQAAPAASNINDIFIETTVDKQSVYVQEQLLLKYRLFYSMNVDSLEAEPLEIENVIKEQIPDVRYNRRINDKLYGIAEFNYALYPQTSGQFTVPKLVWDVKVPRNRRSSTTFFDFTGRYEVKRLRTEEKIIQVLPQPENYPADKPWIPAKSLVIEESWSKEPLDFNIGEPITRTITLKSEGLMSSQLPQMWASFDGDNVKIYADQPELKDEKISTGAVSERIESAAVVVADAGEAILPAITIPWWDVTSNSLKYAQIPERTLLSQHVIKNNQSATSPAPDTDIASRPLIDNIGPENGALHHQLMIWRTASAVLGLILLASMIYILFGKKSRQHDKISNDSDQNDKGNFLEIVKACRKNHAADIRRSLLKWANNYWPEGKISTLKEIASQINDHELEQKLSDLDTMLYSTRSTSHAEGKVILARLKSFIEKDKKTRTKSDLAAFYASSFGTH